MRLVKAGFVYFALVFGAGFPRFGVRIAELIEMPLMLVVVVLAARFIVRRFALAPSFGARLFTGSMALVMLVAAELMLAVVLQAQSLAQYIASRDRVSGSVYLAMLALFAVMPAIL